MRHTFLVVTVKRWLKSVYIYGSYRKIKTGVPLFLDHSVHFTVSYFLYSTAALFGVIKIDCSRSVQGTGLKTDSG